MVGGIENYVFYLSLHQLRYGYEVSVLTLNRDFMTKRKLPHFELHSSGIKIIRIPYFFFKKYPVAPGVFKHLNKFDIINVHAVDFFADFIALTKIFHKKKIILTTHGGYFHTKWGRLIKKLYFATATKFTVSLYDYLIACSNNDYKIFKKISKKISKKILTIENGVNIDPYLNTPKKINNNELLYVGRLDHHKRIDLLISIVASLKEKGHSVHLNIVGPDWNNIAAKLNDYAKKLNVQNSISFKGAVNQDELKKLYSEAFLFVSASEYEGFGITAIEAMASGTLCVLNRIKSFEKFLDNNLFGSLCNFHDKDETVLSITKMLNTDYVTYTKLSQAARDFSKNYSWNTVIKKYNKIYNEF